MSKNNRTLILLLFISFLPFSLIAKTYYVSSIIGDNNYTGIQATIQGSNGPFASIEKAIKLLQHGDAIMLMAGAYHEEINLSNLNNISIKTYGDGEVLLYGTNEEYVNNKTYQWKLVKQESNPYFKNKQYLYVSALPAKSVNLNSKLPDYYAQFNYVFDRKGNPLYGYRKYKDYKERKQGNTNGEGYYFSKDSLYIAVNDPYDSKYMQLHVTKSGFMIKVSACKNFVLDGGSDKSLKLKYGGRYAFFAEGDITGLHLKNVIFEQNSSGVHFSGIRGTLATIENCEFINTTGDKWIWRNVKASLLESTGIGYAKGSIEKLLIKNNNFYSTFNAVVSLPGNTEIVGNFFKNIGDDAVELDGLAENITCHDNLFYNCFTAFSLCPVEKGPVYIYNNIIYSDRATFPYSIKKDGSLRVVPPKTIKFWNLQNGTKLKDGVKQRVSQNIHFYYNTVIAKDQPLSIGDYSQKYASPRNASFYNNIFYSEATLTNSTGFAADGIDIDNNVFFSSFKNRKEPRLFIGWNGRNHGKTIMPTKGWTGNKIIKIEFKKLKGSIQPEKFKLCDKSISRLKAQYQTKKLPEHFPGAPALNSRELPGFKSE